MWLLFLLAVIGLLAYLKIGDLIALRGHEIWRRGKSRSYHRRRTSKEDRCWQWLLFPFSRVGENKVGRSGEGLVAEYAAQHERCPDWYRVLLALIWPVKLAVNLAGLLAFIAFGLFTAALWLLGWLVKLAIDPRETGRRLWTAVRPRPRPTSAEAATRSGKTEKARLAAKDKAPPAHDPLYPGGRRPDWIPDTAPAAGETSDREAEKEGDRE